MIVLDENLLGIRRTVLLDWHIPVRQIGYDLGWLGMSDEDVRPLLRRLRRPTFFTLDSDYYRPHLCYANYCLVYLTMRDMQAANYIRRVLRHPQFNTIAKRMGSIMRVSPDQLTVWRLHAAEELIVAW